MNQKKIHGVLALVSLVVAGEALATKTTYSSAGTNSFTVPAGVTQVVVKAWGAGGGGGGGGSGSSSTGGAGGAGGFVQGVYPVSEGDSFEIIVGGSGGGGVTNGSSSLAGEGGGGGGRSSVSNSTAATLLLVAAGGGGGGGGDNGSNKPGGAGGPGGGTSGTNGVATDDTVAIGGGGGTQTAGGVAGTGAVYNADGVVGSAFAGGAGGNGKSGGGGGTGGAANGGTTGGGHGGSAYGTHAGGGGGGAGYYGGGGGCGATTNTAVGSISGSGGGGGSSYTNSTGLATVNMGGTGTTTSNSSDLDYAAYSGVAARGGAGGAVNNVGTAGNNGLVVFNYLYPGEVCVDGAWNEDASDNWSDTSKWLNGTVANGTNAVAMLSKVLTADQTITLDSDRTLGEIRAQSTTKNYTIGGANTITLASTDEQPIVSVWANRMLTISCPIAGSGGMKKQGSGILSLSGANNYSGGTTISAGQVKIASDGNLGNTSGGITFSGAYSQLLTGTEGLTLAADRTITLNSGAVAAIGQSNQNGTYDFTISGKITGSGDLQVGRYELGSGTTYLANTGNDFTGRLIIGEYSSYTTPGWTIANFVMDVASLADSVSLGSGNIIFGNTSGSAGDYGAFQWSESATTSLALNNRQFQISDTDTSHTKAIIANANSTAGNVLVINTDLSVTATGNKTLQLGGSNSGDNTFAGTIGNGSATIHLAKADSGRWILSGNNTFSGKTTIGGGTLSINTIASVNGGASAIGAPTTVANGTIAIGNPSSATLEYTGSGHTSDRVIDMAGTTRGATLRASGSGPLVLTSDFTASGSGVKTLTLRGGTATNILSGAIVDSAGGATSVRQANGIWKLSGTSTYTGTTTNQVGTLLIGANAPSGSAGALGNATSEVGLGVAGGGSDASILIDGAYTVGRIIRIATADSTDAGARVLTIGGKTADNSEFSGNIVLGTASQAGRGVTLAAASGGTVTFSGVIQNPSSMDATAYTNTISGAGTVVLAGPNTYTGKTTLNGGKSRVAIAENANVTGPLGKQPANASGTILFGGGTLQYSAANQNDYSGRFSTAGSQPVSIDVNSQSVTFATAIQGAGTSLTLADSGTGGKLTLTAANIYSGTTTINGGTLALGASNRLPDSTAVSIGNGTLDSATYSDTVGTLDVTGSATVNLGAGSTLAFANSSGVDWTGGTLIITGTFISGSSLRFGTTNDGLTPGQLALISSVEFGEFSLNSDGYLIASRGTTFRFR